MMKAKRVAPRRRRRKARGSVGGEFTDEAGEWLALTPARRMRETAKLWGLYLALGGNLDPEPDPQSPFYFQDESR